MRRRRVAPGFRRRRVAIGPIARPRNRGGARIPHGEARIVATSGPIARSAVRGRGGRRIATWNQASKKAHPKARCRDTIGLSAAGIDGHCRSPWLVGSRRPPSSRGDGIYRPNVAPDRSPTPVRATGPGRTLMGLAFLPRLLVPVAASAIAVLLDGGPAAAGPAVDPPGVSRVEGRDRRTVALEEVVRIYRGACLRCHDSDGKGEVVRDLMNSIPDFADEAWHATRKDEDLRHSILEGKGKSMPAMRGKLGPVDVGQVVAFVRGFRGGEQSVEGDEAGSAASGTAADPPPGRAADPPVSTRPVSSAAAAPRPDREDARLREGSRTFQRACALCHGGDGRGATMRDALPRIPDFTAHAWQESRTDPRLVASVLDGRGTGMPPFQDRLSGDQVRDLVAFVRSFDPSAMRTVRTGQDDFDARFRRLATEFEALMRVSQTLAAEAATSRGEAESSPPPSRQPPRRRGGVARRASPRRRRLR